MTLWELSEPVARVRGVGKAVEHDLSSLGIETIRDLLLHSPRSYEDRRTRRNFSEAAPDGTVNTEARVVRHELIGGRYGKQTLKVHVADGSGEAALLCFGRNFLAGKLSPGITIRLFGKFSYRYGELQASAFDFEPADAPTRSFNAILPLYPLAGRLTHGVLRRVIGAAMHGFGDHLESTLPSSVRGKLHIGPDAPTTAAALRSLHFPESPADVSVARELLATEELLLLQLRIQTDEAASSAETAREATVLPRDKQHGLKRALPFELTGDQTAALDEIYADMCHGSPMNRLLQGDVGSGKTLVALLTVLPCAEAGFQSVLMAPTELLARQHAENAARFLEPFGVRIALLHGGLKGRARGELLSALKAGHIDLLVGTHAAFTASVEFGRLRLVIIDEQQRFGVAQRSALRRKGLTPDTLFMTATPIPRTLALGLFGHLSISTIRTMPRGRLPVKTHLARVGNETKVYDAVRKELRAGRQAYFVYPLVDGDSKLTLKDATAMRDYLERDIFPGHAVGLVHSRVPEQQKGETMSRFSRGELDLLVATSVVEVGVDVPNATCIVIEHAERFGLAALHQLRGRVGRSTMQSYCFLVYSDELSEAGKERMKVMHRSNDGFEISEEDLRIRGPGNVAGTEQSGYLKLAIADLSGDLDLLRAARDVARDIVAIDPGLLRAEHGTIRRSVSVFAGTRLSE